MNRILVVEDSKFYSSMLRKRIKSALGFETIPAYTYKETNEILERDTDFFIAITDLCLPDAPDGEVVELVSSKNIPLIILTGNFSADMRASMITNKNVIDYILKQETKGFGEIIKLLERLLDNKNVKILIVEDSATQRFRLKRLLQAQNYEVIEAEDGESAMKVLEEHSGIHLVITDFNMPRMDGYDLVTNLRTKFKKDEMVILGMSEKGDAALSARFLKTGANDFINKPFVVEELTARVTQGLEMLDMVKRLKELAVKDPLTKLYNRRYFFEAAAKIFTEAKKKGKPFAVSMLDIDFFKKINDTYGHDAGDKVLQAVASILIENTRGADIVARLGGEEFCIFAPDTDRPGAEILFEKIRAAIESSECIYEGKTIKIAISIGVSTGDAESVDNALRQSDEMLYAAKSQGRNRVVFSS